MITDLGKNSAMVTYDNDTGLFSDTPINSISTFIGLASAVFGAKKYLEKNRDDEYDSKRLKGAYVRYRRYSNRYTKYKDRLDFIKENSNIFTSSYDVLIYEKMETSSNSLLFAMDDIDTFGGDIKNLKDEK